MKYLCIHGHFYQPPRENAWLEEIEIQDSAAPYHDWNERITAECYSPNAMARVLNGRQELVDLMDNYSYVSFNFGPTVLSWMERHEPEVYHAILQADKISQTHYNGHGGAIAQVYNHLIMPLANSRDKDTQVKWGIVDFKKRFGRDPEAIWLSETACDTPTLEVLADNGMKFVILAPGQCARIRRIGEANWTDTGGARVDPKRPYLCNLPSGKQIVLFFYDGPISQGIAFSDTLNSGEIFAGKLLSTYNGNNEAQLMHIATDGETYGHHHRFGEMALAYCLKEVSERDDVNLTVYGDFLEQNPPQYEAQINENTSWSCFHGVERWRSDCGCNAGHPGWNQKWRGPLRNALDFVRDEMIKTFETKGKEYFKDPWAARNDYIDLILDRGLDAQHAFFMKHATEKAWNDRAGALKLLEMQRHAMLMYTSCAWFFDEISGLETVQVIQYAARALELHKQMGGADLEPQFLKLLAKAPSNIKELKNGAVIYERLVRPKMMSAQKIAVQHVLAGLCDPRYNPQKAFQCEASGYQCQVVKNDDSLFCYGSIGLKSQITTEEFRVVFAMCQSESGIFTCGADLESEINKDEVFAKIQEVAQTESYEKAQQLIKDSFRHLFPFTELFKDAQRRVVARVLDKVSGLTTDSFSKIFEEQYPVLRNLKYIGAPLPPAFMTVASYVLTTDLIAEIKAGSMDINSVEELMDDVRSLNISLDMGKVNEASSEKLNGLAFLFAREPEKLDVVTEMVEFLNYMEVFGFSPDTTKAQQVVFLGLEKLGKEKAQKSIIKALCKKLKIAF